MIGRVMDIMKCVMCVIVMETHGILEGMEEPSSSKDK